MINPEWIGYIAGFFTTSAALPQLVKVLRSRHTTSISLWMYVFVVNGGILWIVYGVSIGSPSVIVANLVSLSINSLILILKLRHG